jgi:ABC-type Fe3+-hydroxamate transport system substrate-binding protein
MKLRRHWIFAALLLIGGCARAPQKTASPRNAPAAHGTPATPGGAAFPADDLGRAVAMKAPAQRVVCIGPGATETIFALGAGAQLVGRDQVSDYPAAALKVPVMGDFTGPFPEKVVAARPDLVIVQGETYDAARAQMWEDKIGAPVAVLAPLTVAQVAENIEKIGAWLGRSAQARRLARPLLESAVEKSAAPLGTAFFEVGRAPLWTAGRGTLIDDVMQRARLTNTARGVQGYKEYSLETLATQNPDFYILAREEPQSVKVLRELRAQPVIGQLPCVRAGRVLVVDADLALRPGPRLAQGIQSLRDSARRRRARAGH